MARGMRKIPDRHITYDLSNNQADFDAGLDGLAGLAAGLADLDARLVNFAGSDCFGRWLV